MFGKFSLKVSYDGLTGINAKGSSQTNTDGGLYYTPLTGDMLCTVHEAPQVRLFINDVPTKCNGDCSFDWSTDVTPSLTSVSPTSGSMALGTSVVISGEGFDSEPANNTVMIGGADCVITHATASSITCDVGIGPLGVHKVIVHVEGKGYARHVDEIVTFSYAANITSVSPETGSQGGGLTLTVSGYGFIDAAEVTIGTEPCDVLRVYPTSITCLVPPSAVPGTADVVVMQESKEYLYSGFTYDAALTPVITSIYPSKIGVEGGVITLSGYNFGSSGKVYIGITNGFIHFYNDTDAVFEISGLTPGKQELKLRGEHGIAIFQASQKLKRSLGATVVPAIYVELSVTNVFPFSGSLRGGTRLTITGAGFGHDCLRVKVDVGTIGCDVESVSNTEIVCLIADTGTVHTVTNKGTHRFYGIYYAFDRPQLTIEQGDFVHWSWETPEFINGINHAIIQVESLSSTVAIEKGFSSGKPSRNGNFQHRFNQLGTFYVWSGYVDTYGIKNYAGQIEVVEKMSKLAEITVAVDGIESSYDINATSPEDQISTSECQSELSAIAECSDTFLSYGPTSKFIFFFSKCHTPVVDVVHPNNGTAETAITITGTGFSSHACSNNITFSDTYCKVEASSTTRVTCTLDKLYTLTVGHYLPVSMRVDNRGTALINIMSPEQQTFVIIPNIRHITPRTGSLAGGTLLTITGFAFSGSLSVLIGYFPCDAIMSSYKEIICKTPPSVTELDFDVSVFIMIKDFLQMAICETENRQCKFTYLSSATPRLASIDKTVMSGPTIFIITGSNFGNDTSKLELFIGNAPATIISGSDNSLEAKIENVPAGINKILLRHTENGKALGNLEVTGNLIVENVVPNSGSIYGHTDITIYGNGFVVGKTAVSIGDDLCLIKNISLSKVVCTTPAGSAGFTNLVITSNTVKVSNVPFNFAIDSTPKVYSVSPKSGLSGETLTITGENLSGSDSSVLLDNSPCTIIHSSTSQIECKLGAHATGIVPVYVYVSDFGASNIDITFEYTLHLFMINPNEGSTAGGQTVTLSGQGFSDTASVTICGKTCHLMSTNASLMACKTPPISASSSFRMRPFDIGLKFCVMLQKGRFLLVKARTCDVTVSVNGLTASLIDVYSFVDALTPRIISVSPTRGGTGGGTSLTISGIGFGSNFENANVVIAGAPCHVTTLTDTQLQCETGPHLGSVRGKIEVEISGNGIAKEDSSGVSDFFYIDVWSSNYTWGGLAPPVEGDFVVIPAGQTLLLDTNTPVLSFVLIQGGELIFDEKDLELRANVIMITDGGLLQVGTEAKPFEHKAYISLHGHHRSRELPIYGTKVLAVRNGSLEMHGKEIPLTWTKLASTAPAGTSVLQLFESVNWEVGDEIVIATTGQYDSQIETEKKRISVISADKKTLTLDSQLKATHSVVEEIYNETRIEMRGEVGLLTRNVAVRGNRDPQWTEKVEACPAGFTADEFPVQTCCYGRIEEEIGSSKFGGIILVHAPEKDTHVATAKLSHIEISFAGQAFRPGRYPINFCLNGDMANSYIKGLSIHETFNRAIGFQAVHNTKVDKTVVYNIMGTAILLEDGIESGIIMENNLVVGVKPSSSLMNDDITPAAFGIKNPNNIVQNNAVAGGSHFGYWFALPSRPEGPSSFLSDCPYRAKLGVFQNNSAHSLGWYGLWVFTSYFPLKAGCSGCNVQPAVFRSLSAWNNTKGAEAVNSGSLHFDNFVAIQNVLAGIEFQKISNVPLYTNDSPQITNSVIVGKTAHMSDEIQKCSSGIVLPDGAGFKITNVKFFNFYENCPAFKITKIKRSCSYFCGGYRYEIEKVLFINSPNKVKFKSQWEAILIDKDGSLTGKEENDWKILPASGTLPSECEEAPEFSSGYVPRMCPPKYSFHQHRFITNDPKSLQGKNLIIRNQFGNDSVPYGVRPLSMSLISYGWMFLLVDGEMYKFEFENAEQITNLSYSGRFSEFQDKSYLIIRLALLHFPDIFSTYKRRNYIEATLDGLDPFNATYGDWEWNNAYNEIRVLIRRYPALTPDLCDYGIPFSLSATKCYYKDCIPPPDPDTVAPASTSSPVNSIWHDIKLWNVSSDGYIVNVGGSVGVPQDYDNVRIVFDSWVIVMEGINILGNLVIEGVLEFKDIPGITYEINALNIIIMGGRLIVGWPDQPFLGEAVIILRGNLSSPYFRLNGDGPTVGSKAIGVFGGLDLHGKDPGITWTTLNSTAYAGQKYIVLEQMIAWTPGDEIVIGPSHYDPWETETFRIESVSGFTLILNKSLEYDHLVYRERFPNGVVVNISAPVGLLSHNIKIVGEDYPNLYKDGYGARVLVGLYAMESQTYTGYARLSNVEFKFTGQEGFTESSDARFSLAYIAVGTVSHVKPSSVKKCSFHMSFNSAIGAFGIGGLGITDNVVHHVVGNGIVTSSDETRIIHNMVALIEWTGTYHDRYEPGNFRWEAGIQALWATQLVLQDNVVTGSERIGFRVPPLECNDLSGSYSNNMAYGNLIGIGILPEDRMFANCAEYSGFVAWKNHDFGIYYQNAPSLRLRNNILVDNRQGIWTGIAGPSALEHIVGKKTVEIADSLVIGASPAFYCAVDVSPKTDNMALSARARPGMAPNGGLIGLVFPNLMSTDNFAPRARFSAIASYYAIAGLMKLRNVTFAYFESSSCGGAFAVGTNVYNDDGQHPIEAEKIGMFRVSGSNKIIYHRPNINKINPADCVDMDCDGLKKALFKDLDGTFLGHKGSVIPLSEFEWGTNSKRGLGDHRIPKEMVTELNGTRIPYDHIAPYKGIIRNSNCSYKASWQAYECWDELNYELLIIESMDKDTERRRLSPVALLGDGYIDLINGPQDHSICTNYHCRKRLSTFMAIVATGKEYLMHFTSTTPFHMRYHLLNTETEAVKLTVWYSRPNRLDVYVNGTLIMAKNAEINDLGFYILKIPIADELEPSLTDATGTNKIDHIRGEHTLIIRGSTPVEVKTNPMIVISFGLPAMSVDDFYGANVIENIASFLSIPLKKVRVVNAVSEKSISKRHKRNDGGTLVEVEIGDEPSFNSSETVPDSLDTDTLLNLASDIMNECQLGDLGTTLNLTGNCESLVVPAESANASLIVYGTPRPEKLVFTVELISDYENVPLKTQPKIQAIDAQSVPLTVLGTLEHPWQILASIRKGTGHPDAVLSGTLTINASYGWFNFTDIVISHKEAGYILDFNVTYPEAARNFTIASSPFYVDWPPIEPHVISKTEGDILSGNVFSIGIDLRNSMTNEIFSDIGWRNHSWYAAADMLGNPKYGELQGMLTTTFDTFTGRAMFPELKISGVGFFYIQFRVTSDPPDFNFTWNEKIVVFNSSHAGMIPEEHFEIQVKFSVDYDGILFTGDRENEFEQMILSEFANTWSNVRIRSGSIARGSITVTFMAEGTKANLDDMTYGLCDSIANSTNYTFYDYTLTLDKYMTVDNETFYGVACATTVESSSSFLIIVIVLALAVVIIISAAAVIWKFCCNRKLKDMLPKGPQYIGKDDGRVLEQLFQENSFARQAPLDTEITASPGPGQLGFLPRPFLVTSVDNPNGIPSILPISLMKDEGLPMKTSEDLHLIRDQSGLSVSTLFVQAEPEVRSENTVLPNSVFDKPIDC